MSITIKELSEWAGVKVPTIRYYERQGLLPEPVRTGTGQRRYGSVDVTRLRFIRFGRGVGMEIGEIRALIEMVGEGNGEEIIVAAEAIGDRAERMEVLCASLRSVSAAIIAGSIDEASAFDRLIARDGTEMVALGGEPATQVRDFVAEAKEEAEPPTGAEMAEEAVSMLPDLVKEEPATQAVTERDASRASLPKPKRKRTRARS